MRERERDHTLKVFCGEWGVAMLSWVVAISKSEFSVSLCKFSKERPMKKIDKELDNMNS